MARAISTSRRFRRRPYTALGLLLTLVMLAISRLWHGEPLPGPTDPLVAGSYPVQRVVDGDTIIVAPHTIVRLIGVNTPETVKPEHPVEPWGPEASAFTKHFLSGGTARLEFDRERLDRFGRHLAYVWVGEKMLNESLLRAGLARFEPHFHYSEVVKRRFRQAQQQAQRDEVGIWSDAGARSQPNGFQPEREPRHRQLVTPPAGW